jgi:hypothetical protein
LVWLERTHRKARIPNSEVLAVRVANLDEKAALLAMDPERFFTEPHYNGYPAILIRLAAIEPPLLEELITSAWHCSAPKSLKSATRRTSPKRDSLTSVLFAYWRHSSPQHGSQ